MNKLAFELGRSFAMEKWAKRPMQMSRGLRQRAPAAPVPGRDPMKARRQQLERLDTTARQMGRRSFESLQAFAGPHGDPQVKMENLWHRLRQMRKPRGAGRRHALTSLRASALSARNRWLEGKGTFSTSRAGRQAAKTLNEMVRQDLIRRQIYGAKAVKERTRRMDELWHMLRRRSAGVPSHLAEHLGGVRGGVLTGASRAGTPI
jgi:hypothetical protein